ncbi:Sugar kinase and transcription regulator [Pediococcus damnosus]|uniref:Sugar kinase and transcription regulator n=1 Tax=Pediococcus damnosus TaxID=51663 RepID=A0A0R2H673_9LACO|nr:ROK family protein [Pediococcus damnosus]AMV60219.1 Sugar kinase and transcription regulator [Pediococcus damnosus]AMV62746.1 Sugar kinase and transcription regulator [Pediococcus damnosus]AMV64469.1 Sugar kinase and transcription regulator [Pediococcus damnosus]AMV67372.1 Sugar kinase and transcription regulator [Pediococcus damnosus]KJU74237.1 transcriptional regulator [Pediococcus damnosus LMG 28219]
MKYKPEKDYLSIDIGATYTKYALIDHSGNLKIKSQFTTPRDNVNNFLKKIYAVINEVLPNIKGVAFSVPGKIDQKEQIIYYGGSLPMLHGLSLSKIISSRYELPVSMENSGNSAALAELWLGNLKDIKNGAAIILGNSVEGGIVLNGELWHGSNIQGGELGFMLSQINGPAEDPNNLMFTAGSAVQMIDDIATALDFNDRTDGMRVFKAIQNGDEQARHIFEQYCRRIAYIILNIQSILDLSRFVIGGGISSESILVPEIKHQLQLLFDENSLLRKSLSAPEILTASFKSDATLYGALYNLLLQLNDEELIQDLSNEDPDNKDSSDPSNE